MTIKELTELPKYFIPHATGKFTKHAITPAGVHWWQEWRTGTSPVFLKHIEIINGRERHEGLEVYKPFDAEVVGLELETLMNHYIHEGAVEDKHYKLFYSYVRLDDGTAYPLPRLLSGAGQVELGVEQYTRLRAQVFKWADGPIDELVLAIAKLKENDDDLEICVKYHDRFKSFTVREVQVLINGGQLFVCIVKEDFETAKVLLLNESEISVVDGVVTIDTPTHQGTLERA